MIYEWLTGAARGLVEAFGPASAKVELVDDPAGNGAVALVRQGFAVQRFEGPKTGRRLHRFDDLASMAGWLKKHADPATTEIAISGDTAKAVAILDPASARSDVVECVGREHPRLADWVAVLGRPMSQRDLQRHIAARSGDFLQVQGENGAALGSVGQMLAAQLLRVQLTKGAQVTVELDELGFTRISGSNRETAVSGKLPPRFTVRVPYYLHGPGWAMYDLEILLEVVETAGGIAFALTCPGLEVARLQAVSDMAVALRTLLGEPWLVGMGTVTSVPTPAEAKRARMIINVEHTFRSLSETAQPEIAPAAGE